MLEDTYKELIKLRAQRAVGSAIESPGKIKALRRAIARILMLDAAIKPAEKGGQK
ncbi:MAG: 50S ribosomal protein L29 [DPANN group archaeon]|nr:50S ribosomal protein L29 [DPANN group archaeon]